uniref:Uncharacterized protein n=1 Tax=Pseudo-nitzschia australis TaxID=44445 RepID=A0A7S4AJV5_9STRA|mmetsp:Transcript_11929/g.25223  ORF Transcript_11929/g.25223 Transcript_11929/m.25223 type:complete len:107 (-) Transcript_11929:229-549(-)|eukprot:CAMPEP_0168180514 /NCGR_PEP_ID=MMETSP0139_2-20121125/10585_1 /TAXON_ID=44445 /ORGANISM="Pseudo-nitzschia australis, Strain 10249 10 AB" /LENGTH=106 /DNA_ID=CAMNT_0008100751 /DNA_START=941 /DNA_END=1261 /DNA_ORIENTATION=-
MSSYSSTGSYISQPRTSDQTTLANNNNSNDKDDRTHTSTHRRRSSSINNSVVEAMITSNNLRNCREVMDMVIKCQTNNDDGKSFVCNTAQRYYIGGCMKNNHQEQR